MLTCIIVGCLVVLSVLPINMISLLAIMLFAIGLCSNISFVIYEGATLKAKSLKALMSGQHFFFFPFSYYSTWTAMYHLYNEFRDLYPDNQIILIIFLIPQFIIAFCHYYIAFSKSGKLPVGFKVEENLKGIDLSDWTVCIKCKNLRP